MGAAPGGTGTTEGGKVPKSNAVPLRTVQNANTSAAPPASVAINIPSVSS